MAGVRDAPGGSADGTNDGSSAMDMGLITAVLWRYKWLVAAGFILAVGLAGLVFKRAPNTYRSSSTLIVTKAGFPWGRATEGSGGAGDAAVPQGDQTRLTNLATLYAQLAGSDAVRGLISPDGKLDGKIAAAPVVPRYSSGAPTLPLLSISATSSTPAKAVALAQDATSALRTYLVTQQQQASIPRQDRVVVDVVRSAQKATVAQSPKKTLPTLVFLAVMLAVFGLAMLLEHARLRRSEERRAELAPVAPAAPLAAEDPDGHASPQGARFTANLQ